MSLFGAEAPSQTGTSAGSSGGALVTFRAGRMTLEGKTVTADPRKGQVILRNNVSRRVYSSASHHGEATPRHIHSLMGPCPTTAVARWSD